MLRALSIILIVCIICCSKDELSDYSLTKIDIPFGFPEIVYPTDNTFTTTRWELGKKLFYDKRLSIDSTLSCASCHKQEFAFSDNVSLSNGVKFRPGVRNVPSITNVAFHPYYTREGGLPTLEQQVLVPIQEHNEFDFNIVDIYNRLKNDVTYVAMAEKAYNRTFDAYVITRAIATFERSLISAESKYDKMKAGKLNLTSSEQKGMDLFYSSRTNCSQCHSGILFSNFSFKNNGLYEDYLDEGRYRLTLQESDRALFKVPSLRNVGLTAPYMFDGSLQTLESVIDHYDSGGKSFKNKSELIKPLNLTVEEKKNLVQFLRTLSDHEILINAYLKE